MSTKPINQNLILNEDEEILSAVRQSPLTLIKNLLVPILLILTTFFFLYPLFSWGDQGIFLFFSILAVSIIILARNSLLWYWQILIITNQRIVDIDQPTLFQRIVSESDFNNINDVFYKSRGLYQILTKIGTINIKLKDQTIIEVKNIYQPRNVQQLILRLKSDHQKNLPDLELISKPELISLIKKIRKLIGEQEFAKTILKDLD